MNISAQAIIATININLLQRPLWRDYFVQECLGIDRRRLLNMIQSGQLAFAWNIGFGNKTKELRILAHCVVENQTGPIAGIGRTRDLELPEVLKLLLPQRRETLRAVELQRLFWVNPDMIREFGKRGDLKKLRENLPKQGPNSSPRFTVASVAKFLEERRIV